MKKNAKTVKSFRIPTDTNTRLLTLVAHENAINEVTGLSAETETSIAIKAIDFYYYSKMSKEAMDQSVDKMQQVLGNVMELLLKGYFDQLAIALNTMNRNDNQILTLLVSLIKANNVLPEDYQKMMEVFRKISPVYEGAARDFALEKELGNNNEQ